MGKLSQTRKNITTLCMSMTESEIGSEIMDEHFYNLTELPSVYYEVEKVKKKINLDLPIHLGVFILNYAKLQMLEFYYDFSDYYLLCEEFICWKWIRLAAILVSLQKKRGDLIKPKLKEQFEREKPNWFVTPLAPQDKRTPGLFKVELKGDQMIGLCSKSYCTELFATEIHPSKSSSV